MGGGKVPYSSAGVPVNDLVHRFESSETPEPKYSDEHTKRMMEERKKEMDKIISALSRLGIIDELAPSGMIPRMPYRPVEQEFGF
jgi:hypothetical protein